MNNNGNLTKQLCSIHGIQFIQAGPHLFCSQCLLHEADKRSTEKARDFPRRPCKTRQRRDLFRTDPQQRDRCGQDGLPCP